MAREGRHREARSLEARCCRVGLLLCVLGCGCDFDDSDIFGSADGSSLADAEQLPHFDGSAKDARLDGAAECSEGSMEACGRSEQDECSLALDDCDRDPPACIDRSAVQGGYACACPEGYTGMGAGRDGCQNVDECDRSTTPCESGRCVDTRGSYRCCADTCESVDKVACQDGQLSTCVLDQDGCRVSSVTSCTNGFCLDGRHCAAIRHRQWGTPLDDYVRGVTADAQGSLYLVGYTEGAFMGESSAGFEDAFVMKVSGDGERLWTRQFGTSSNDRALAVALDTLSDVYVVGYTGADLSGSREPAMAKNDIFLSRLTTNGGHAWTKQWGTEEDDFGAGVALDRNDNVYVAGWTQGALGLSYGKQDAVAIRLDTDGQIAWTHQWGSLEDEVVSGIAVDRNGVPYVAGSTQGNMDGEHFGDWDAFVSRLNPSGTGWPVSQQWGSPESDEFEAIAFDNMGYPIMVGSSDGDLAGEQALQASDLITIRATRFDTTAWVRQLGSDDVEQARAVAADPTGAIYVVGSTLGEIGPGAVSAGGYDAVLAKLDREGVTQWVTQWGSSEDDVMYGIAITPNGSIQVAGGCKGALADAGTQQGGGDICLTSITAQP